HRQIFHAMALLSEERTHIDLVTLTNQLRTMDQLNVIGGPRYLGELSELVPTSLNWTFYSNIVAKYSLGRRLIESVSETATDASSEEFEIEASLNEAEAKIMSRSEARPN